MAKATVKPADATPASAGTPAPTAAEQLAGLLGIELRVLEVLVNHERLRRPLSTREGDVVGVVRRVVLRTLGQRGIAAVTQDYVRARAAQPRPLPVAQQAVQTQQADEHAQANTAARFAAEQRQRDAQQRRLSPLERARLRLEGAERLVAHLEQCPDKAAGLKQAQAELKAAREIVTALIPAPPSAKALVAAEQVRAVLAQQQTAQAQNAEHGRKVAAQELSV